MRIHIIWAGRDSEHGVDLIGTGMLRCCLQPAAVGQPVLRQPALSAGAGNPTVHGRMLSGTACCEASSWGAGLCLVTVPGSPCSMLHCCLVVPAVPASLATYLACQAFDPDLIISAGTAGGFKARVRCTHKAFLLHAAHA